LETLCRSRILSRIWVAPKQKEKAVYELTEILDAHHLFRALSGKIQGYGISLPQFKIDAIESGRVAITDFEQLVKLQEFLISLMLIAPIDPVNATGWDPTNWDKKLKELEGMKYALFIGIDRPHSRIDQLARADDWSITRQTERPRTYIWDLRDPLQDEIDEYEEYVRQMEEVREWDN
jgi:hypothetical protein